MSKDRKIKREIIREYYQIQIEEMNHILNCPQCLERLVEIELCTEKSKEEDKK